MGNLIIPGETALCGRLYKEWLAQNDLSGKAPEPVETPAVGLQNLRNMCFLNAILQSLYHAALLRRNLALALESSPVKDEWLNSLLQLFKELDQSRRTKVPVAASKIATLMQVASTNGEFQQGEQADAHEALMVLISKLLNGCISGKGLSCAEREQMERSSLIGHVFGLSLGQSVSCKSCKDESKTMRAEYCLCVNCTSPLSSDGDQDAAPKMKLSAKALAKYPGSKASPKSSSSSPGRLAVPLQAPTVVDVRDLLQSYTEKEEIPEWKCDKCSQQGCIRRAYVSHRPNILQIHVTRQQNESTPRVSFSEELNLSNYMLKSEVKGDACRYLLFAVIVYRPLGANGGHYFAYVRSRRDKKDQWSLVDDDEVKSVTWSMVQQEDPYMLIYEACKVVPPIATDTEKKLKKAQTNQQAEAWAKEVAAKAEEEARLRAQAEEEEQARLKAEAEAEAAEERRLKAEMEEEARRRAQHVREEEEAEERARQEARQRAQEEEERILAIAKAKAEQRAKLEQSQWFFFPGCRFTSDGVGDFADRLDDRDGSLTGL
eukprot:gb/GFBE01066559.1/.p1 GENE.gb/GFBE01066559.1/~~gb/GFBE01066559.1/.p1  ORF type:complete len:546 (+),score=155.93 gb/GFBE01066559.1/:1-1638(+)